jgi:hypothetical protein
LRLPFAAKTPADSLGVRSIDPMIDYLPSMVESLRASVLKLGLLSESDLTAAVNECRQHLAKPGTAFTMYSLPRYGDAQDRILAGSSDPLQRRKVAFGSKRDFVSLADTSG